MAALLARFQSQPKDEPVPNPSFREFLQAVSPSWHWDWPHIAAIRAELEALAAGEIENLMVLCPPQHGKTELATVRFALWLLACDQTRRVILGAYNQDYANKLSRKIRRMAPGRLDIAADRSAMNEWELKHGGFFKAVGVGSGVTGNPADWGLLDDPVKGRQDAESETFRDRLWEWYTDDFSTRIQPGGHKLLIMTPWHHDDLHGRILGSAEADRWSVLRLPAICEEEPDPIGRKVGQPLCPERRSLTDLLMIQKRSPYSFQAMFQCAPSSREGSMFRIAMAEIVDAAPAGLPAVRSWDMAASTDGDWTAGVLMAGPDKDGFYYVMDSARHRFEPSERNRIIRQTAELDGRSVRVTGPQDPGAAGKEAAKAFVRLLSGFSVSTAPVTGDKQVRADPFAAQFNAGNVRLVRGDWNREYIEELRQFPRGRHDDQVDASSDAFNALALSGWSASRLGLEQVGAWMRGEGRTDPS